MAMFGKAGQAAARMNPSGLSRADKLALFGAMMSDVGAAMRGGQGDALLNAQGMMAARQAMAQEADWRRQFGGLFGAQAGAMPPPVMNEQGEDISAAFGAAGAPSAAPGRVPTVRDALPLILNAPKGVNVAPFISALEASQPQVEIGPDGRPYDKRDPGVLSQRFGKPEAVNDVIVDLNDPNNIERHIPKLGEGMTYQRDASGRAVGVQNAPGYVDALSQATGAKAGAEAGARAPYDFIRVPQPGGGEAVVSKSQAAGGVFEAQRPDDAAFSGEVAKSEAKRYEGILAAGQNAKSMEANLRRMSNLLDGLNTGRLTPAGKELASVASSLGVKVDSKWGNVEAADAIANKLALDLMGGSLGAGFSNADRDFVRSMTPQTANTPQGRALMIDFALKKAQRDQQIASMARKWQSQAGRLDKPDRNGRTFYDYLEAWGETNPLVQ